MSATRLTGRVVKIVSEDELVINVGSANGAAPNMIFSVPDDRLQNIVDPETNEPLGSFSRPRVRLKLVEVSERMSLAERYTGGVFSSVEGLSRTLYGTTLASSVVLGTPVWREGVRVGDTVVQSG